MYLVSLRFMASCHVTSPSLSVCLCRLSSDVDLRVLTFPDFGKDLPKQFKLSPDGFMQTAIQLAYWK